MKIKADPKVFYALMAAVLVYEAYAVYDDEEGNTITEIVQEVAKKPLVNFSFGFLCGHLFG